MEFGESAGLESCRQWCEGDGLAAGQVQVLHAGLVIAKANIRLLFSWVKKKTRGEFNCLSCEKKKSRTNYKNFLDGNERVISASTNTEWERVISLSAASMHNLKVKHDDSKRSRKLMLRLNANTLNGHKIEGCRDDAHRG